MSQLNGTSFGNFYGTTGTTFPDNTSGEISEGDLRAFGQDIKDSFLNKTDGGTITGNIGIGITPSSPIHSLKVDNTAPHQIWTNNGGANNEYLSLYNFDGEWLLTSNKNGTGVAKTLHFGVGGVDDIATSSKLQINSGGINLPVTPTQNNTEDNLLVRNSVSGDIQYRTVASLGTGSDGFYTPTLVNVSNVTTSSAEEAFFLRVGSKVYAFGQINVEATALGLVVIAFNFPVSVTSILANQASGTVASGDNEEMGHILADDVNLRAELRLVAKTTTNHKIYYHYGYLVT